MLSSAAAGNGVVDNIAADQFSVDFSKYYFPTSVEWPFPSLFFLFQGKHFFLVKVKVY